MSCGDNCSELARPSYKIQPCGQEHCAGNVHRKEKKYSRTFPPAQRDSWSKSYCPAQYSYEVQTGYSNGAQEEQAQICAWRPSSKKGPTIQIHQSVHSAKRRQKNHRNTSVNCRPWKIHARALARRWDLCWSHSCSPLQERCGGPSREMPESESESESESTRRGDERPCVVKQSRSRKIRK